MSSLNTQESGEPTYNPLLSPKEELKRWTFPPARPKPESGKALVLIGSGGMLGVLPSEQVRYSELRWGNYQAYYRVDVTEHWLALSLDLLCATEGAGFQADVTLSCRVTDPLPIVERNITDVSRPIKAHLISLMNGVSSRHEVDRRAAAQQQLQEQLPVQIEVAGMLLAALHVSLTLDARSAAIAKQRWEISESIKTEQIQQLRAKQKLQNEQELQLMNSTFDLNLRRTNTHFDLEMAQAKMAVYEPLLKQGSLSTFALRIAENPGDIPVVAEALQKKENELLLLKFKAWHTMLERGAQEGWELRGQSQVLMNDLFATMGLGTVEQGAVASRLNMPEIMPDPLGEEPDFKKLDQLKQADL